MTTDPIADLLTRMRNAFQSRRERLVAPYSRMNTAILQVLKERRFITDFQTVKNGPFSEIEITLDSRRPEFNLKRVSKPGQRIYIKKSDISPVRNYYGIAILSTPKGVMTGEDARKQGLGGEYLCQIW